MRPAPSVRDGFVLAALILIGGGLGGCRSGSAVHSRYNDFRAYYNTYYNASRKLEEGERSLQRTDAPVDRGLLVPVFPVTPASGNQAGPFQEAVDKSAELLRNRPTSKWADDALLVIGKAYYYQRNVVGAEQKFRETMAAADLTGDRRLGDEARFWLGRTLAAADRYDDGVAVLEEGLIAEGGDRRWTARMRLALGELYARAGRWEEAAAALREGAPEVGDADLEARAYVLLGQVEEHAGRYEEAAEAYAAALRARPAYELAFAAEVNRALVLGLDAGRADEGLEAVGQMLRDDKHYERRGELALVRARLLAAAGEPDAARQQFLAVLYDDELNAGAVRGQAHYRLGEFYRDEMGDYVRASAHFDTAATGYRAPPATERPARSAILDLADEARTYNLLAASARRIAEVDSLLGLGDLGEEAFRERIAQIEAERRRVYAEDQRRLRAQREAQAFAGGGAIEGSIENRGSDALSAAGAQVQNGGFLNHRTPEAVQAGYVSFTQRWGDRPLVDNWRREAAVRASAIASDVGGLSDDAGRNPFAFGEGPPPLDLSAVPRTPAQRAELITELAGLRYELANAFFLSLGRADTAAALYRSILADTPDVPVAARAQYALGEIELAAGRAEAARPYYEAVIAADPESVLAKAALARLSRNAVAEAEVETPAAYDAARHRWTAGEPREAAADFLALADAAPEDPLAPRAYFAAAAAYVEWAMPDTLALGGPMPADLVSPVLLDAAIGLGEDADDEGGDAAPPAPPAPAVRRALEEEVRPDEVAPRSLSVEDLEDGPVPALETAVEDAPVVGQGEELGRPQPLEGPPTPEEPIEAGGTPGLGVGDTLAAAPAGGETPVHTAPAVSDTASFTLHDHLRALAALYPGTEAATRAAAMLRGLPPRWVPVDSTAAPVGPVAGDPLDPDALGTTDSLLTDSLRTDSLGVEAGPPVDSLAGPELEPTDPEAADEAEVATDLPALRGPEPLDLGGSGVAWRVETLSIPTEGAATLRVLHEAGYRAAIGRDAGAGIYALLIGQFETEAEAEAARAALPAWARARGEVVPLATFEPAVNPRDDF